MKSVQPNKSPRERREALLEEKHGIVKTDCETCTTENIKRRYSSVQSAALLGKIRTAWCHYNALNAELEYSLSDGGETDVTRDQVNHAWEDMNSLIMPNAEAHGRAVARTVQPLVGHSESEDLK